MTWRWKPNLGVGGSQGQRKRSNSKSDSNSNGRSVSITHINDDDDDDSNNNDKNAFDRNTNTSSNNTTHRIIDTSRTGERKTGSRTLETFLQKDPQGTTKKCNEGHENRHQHSHTELSNSNSNNSSSSSEDVSVSCSGSKDGAGTKKSPAASSERLSIDLLHPGPLPIEPLPLKLKKPPALLPAFHHPLSTYEIVVGDSGTTATTKVKAEDTTISSTKPPAMEVVVEDSEDMKYDTASTNGILLEVGGIEGKAKQEDQDHQDEDNENDDGDDACSEVISVDSKPEDVIIPGEVLGLEKSRKRKRLPLNITSRSTSNRRSTGANKKQKNVPSASSLSASDSDDNDDDDDVAEIPSVASCSPTTPPPPSQHGGGTVTAASMRRALREEERQKRLHGKLTDLSLRELVSVGENSEPDFFVHGVVMCVRGAFSQFDVFPGRLKRLMPPVTNDCCQTFSAVSAILLSSLGYTVQMEECCNPSTVNYLLYISAWLHQLTKPAWPQHGPRPTVADLNACLSFHEFFPSAISIAEEFEVVFYHQSDRAMQLIRELCMPQEFHPLNQQDTDKDENEEGKKSSSNNNNNSSNSNGPDGEAQRHAIPVRGYVIVSGEYTVSIFSLRHDIQRGSAAAEQYSEAWSLYICDSHGTQPWAKGKASVSCVSFGKRHGFSTSRENEQSSLHHQQNQLHVPSNGSINTAAAARGSVAKTTCLLPSMEEGLRYFSMILFSLLEDHRGIAKAMQEQQQQQQQQQQAPLAAAPVHSNNGINNSVNISMNTNTPYMTWTPIHRPNGVSKSADELKNVIDRHWLPRVLKQKIVRDEVSKFDFAPLECFWGLSTQRATPK